MNKWAYKEFGTISLGDKRLNRRAQKILSDLSSQPENSIPTACSGWAETKAAYRFFENSRVTSDAILSPHREATLTRIKQHSRVFVIQDTTELNYPNQKQKEGVGPSKNDNNKTLFLHPSLIVTPTGVSLGVYDDYQWHREELYRHRGTKQQNNNARLHRKHISEKESYRWVCGYDIATDIAKLCPDTHVVMMADRESDIFDVYDQAEKTKGTKADWLIRVNKNRVLLGQAGKRENKKMCEYIEGLPACEVIEFELPKRNGSSGRKVKQELKAGRVTLHPPTGRRGRLRLSPVEVTVLLAKEVNPPEGEEPINWWLMTNFLIKKDAKASDLISWYLCRWQIEVFFRILKSGCQVENLQLTTAKRTRSCLAIYLIIAWRVLFLTSIAKINPDKSCNGVLEYEEWATAYIMINKRRPPKKAPSLGLSITLLAKMGGYLGRKNDSPPGPKAIWKGITKLYEILKFNKNLSAILNPDCSS